MKKIASWLLVMALALSCIGIIACSGGETEMEEEEEEEAAASHTEEETIMPSGGDITWNDMPVYFGGKQIQKAGWVIPPAEGEWSKIEWRYYETSSSVDEVAEFYRSRMPSKGWNEMFWMEAEEVSWAFYNKNNEQDGAMIWVAADNGDTVFALMRATQ